MCTFALANQRHGSLQKEVLLQSKSVVLTIIKPCKIISNMHCFANVFDLFVCIGQSLLIIAVWLCQLIC